jgi:hypothetical protein
MLGDVKMAIVLTRSTIADEEYSRPLKIVLKKCTK